jgi:hypothetical protein
MRSRRIMRMCCSGCAQYLEFWYNRGSPRKLGLTFIAQIGGGIVTPVNTFAVLSPWLAVVGAVGCIGTVVVVAKKRRN